MANLTGIVAGREAREVRAVDIPRTVVYLSAQAHHSLEKALRVAGLGECVLRFLELDECYRIRPDALATAVETDRADALIPWLVVASAGTTDVGAVDPIEALADVCQQQDLWLHVDDVACRPVARAEPAVSGSAPVAAANDPRPRAVSRRTGRKTVAGKIFPPGNPESARL